MGIAHAVRRMRGASVIWVFHDVEDQVWFRKCVDEIAAAHEVVPLDELASDPVRRHSCAVTFDDGLRSVAEIAHPVLRERGLPYAVFVCTDVLTGGPVPWFLRLAHLVDQLTIEHVTSAWEGLGKGTRDTRALISVLKQVPVTSLLESVTALENRYGISPPDPSALFLSADEVRKFAADGVTIGSHTHRHAILSVLPADEQRYEVDESAKVIEGLIGGRPTTFAYPNGSTLDYNEATRSLVAASGFRVAVTTNQRCLGAADDPLALPRIGLGNRDSATRRFVKSVVPGLAFSNRREQRLRSRYRPSVRSIGGKE
jgi:peptidoglycan/xylan/chitin deacetylase (PgdA/CDA1 family)